MKTSYLKYLVCPDCHEDLYIGSIDDQQGDRITSGSLTCKSCEKKYPVINSIPRFVPAENYADNFGLQWNIHNQTQYDQFSGTDESSMRFFSETGWPRSLAGELMLEAGCGSGRFTHEAVKTGAMVISFDYSNAVEANYKANGDSENLLILQADIFNPPLRRHEFDKLFCFGVLQHTPNPYEAFKSLKSLVKYRGELVIDVYKKNALGKFLSFTPAPPTKYYVRPFTTRVAPEKLYRAIVRYINFMWPLSRLIGKIPLVGRNLNWLLLVADHRNLGLDDETAKQWAYLNTFDMLSPKYDYPQRLKTVREWFSGPEFANCEVDYGYNGIVGRAQLMEPETNE